MLRSKMMWFACALDKACVIELQFLEAAKVAPKCWFRPVFLTSSYSLWFGRLWIAKRPERSLLNLYPPTNKVGCCGSANHHILSTINLLRKNCYSCESKWMEHTVRNLHFLFKNSTLISRENCRFLGGWKTRENVVVLDFLAVDNFDFTRKIVKKNLGEKLVKMLGFCQNWIFGQKFDF